MQRIQPGIPNITSKRSTLLAADATEEKEIRVTVAVASGMKEIMMISGIGLLSHPDCLSETCRDWSEGGESTDGENPVFPHLSPPGLSSRTCNEEEQLENGMDEEVWSRGDDLDWSADHQFC